MKEFMNYDFNISKIVFACFVPAGTGTTVHTNRPSHGLAIHKAGEKNYTFSDGKTLTVKENDIIYLPKNSTYKVSSKINGDCYAINFDISENISFDPFVVKAKNHKAITDHFRVANRIYAGRGNGCNLKCKAELYNIIYTVQQEYFSEYISQKKLEIIQPALEYIHNNYTNQIISIDTISALCTITPEYLRKLFKKFYGVSPVTYINNLKITRAEELLKSQLYSVSEAAVSSGYSDISHFSREFKKATGVCPSEYIRNSVQK